MGPVGNCEVPFFIARTDGKTVEELCKTLKGSIPWMAPEVVKNVGVLASEGKSMKIGLSHGNIG